MIIRNENITTAEVRRLLREPSNRTDSFFLGFALARNALNFRFAQSTPTALKRLNGFEPDAKYGTNRYGRLNIPKLRYLESLNFKFILPESQYNPLNKTEINNGTKIGPRTPISLFTNGLLNNLRTLAERKEIAKYFYLQSLLINAFNSNKSKFRKASLSVVEGLYAPETNQTLEAGGILDLQTKGRAVVYEVRNTNGELDPAAAFNIATYWKDNMLFDELILSFDTVDPNVDYTAQIIVTMPEVDDKYKGPFRRKVRTEYNYNIALTDGLAEFAV